MTRPTLHAPVLLMLASAGLLSAAEVTLTGSDGFGASSFNSAGFWDNAAPPGAGNDYATGNFILRTPPDGASHSFQGDSLAVDNNNGYPQGLFYKGSGNTGTITVANLVLDGGMIAHGSGAGDAFNLAGSITVASDSQIYAKQGPINLLAGVHGSASITNPGSDGSGRVLTFLSATSTFDGNLVNEGRFTLADGAVFHFTLGSPGVNNAISGAGPTILDGDFSIDTSLATSTPDDRWDLVTAANPTYGPGFSVAGWNEAAPGVWFDPTGTWRFTTSDGMLLVSDSLPALPGNGLAIAPDGVWTWFNDERAIFHQGSLFAGYVRTNGEYGVTRYDPATNTSHHMTISTGASSQQDDHNNPSITVLPDGRLMVLYAKHLGGGQFYQRTSLVALPSNNADWGDEIIRPLPDNNTYNNTYRLSGESDRIYNFHRCINFNPTITVSDDLGATWEASQPFIEVGSGGVRPYPRYCSNNVDRIDLIYTDGHPRDVDNSVYHMYYESDGAGTPGGGSFHKTDGSVVDSYANLPLDHEGGERGSTVYQFSNSPWGPGDGPDDWIPGARGWTWDVHYGADGHPVCVFQVQLGSDGGGFADSRIYYYHARWTGSGWQKRFIAKAGRGIYSGESDYGGGMTIDPENPNVIYISSNASAPFDLADVYDVPLNPDARFELYRGVTDDGGLSFTWEALTEDSEFDNLRPIVPEDSPYDRTLVWFSGTYNSYTNYNCRVLALLENELKVMDSSFDPDSNTGSIDWISSPGRRYRIGAAGELSTGFPLDGATGVDSEGNMTSHDFSIPAPLIGQPRGFFRVEEE